jgi:hypothetical protein
MVLALSSWGLHASTILFAPLAPLREMLKDSTQKTPPGQPGGVFLVTDEQIQNQR